MPLFDITEDVVFDLTGRGYTSTLGSTTYLAWDCSIGGLPFLFATSDQYAMRRETADFRRQRIDNERNPGEQSLDSGYWIRSQSSWHYGAGLTTAEPLEVNDAEAAFRFARSGGVDVWTPGRASLLKATTQKIADAGTGQLLIGVDTGVLFAQGVDLSYQPNSGSSSAVTWGGSHTIASLTSNGSSYFVADETGIWKGTLPNSAGSRIYTTASAGMIRWVKQRLMTAVGQSLYEITNISPSSPPAALPTALFTHPNSSWTWTDFAEGPATIYVSGYAGDVSTIYSIGVTASSSAVTLDQPVVVAELPRGELVKSLYTYVGSYVVVGTSKGVRIAAIGSDGRLSMGPLIVEIDGGSTDAVAIDRYVYVTGAANVDAGDRTYRAGLYRIDLGQPLASADLRYAYASDITAPSGTSGSAVQVTVADGNLYFAVDGAGLYAEGTTYVSEGWLETGRIRLGTLENKAWHDIRLIMDQGNAGSVTAYASSDDYTYPSVITPILTVTGTYHDQYGSFKAVTEEPEPDAYVAFKLKSNGAGTADAAFIGYQLRAMPAPKRSRLIQVPLMLFNFEIDKKGVRHGQDGGAYARLLALESLENSAATVIYQDFTTGEYAEAYIEKVAFTRTTPPTRSSSNAGGVAQVLLRLV